jgi:hypothetical protein
MDDGGYSGLPKTLAPAQDGLTKGIQLQVIFEEPKLFWNYL